MLPCSAAPPSEVTFGAVAADLLHSLPAGGGAPCVVKVQSLFVLDENSCPLQQEFSLLDLYPDSGEPGPSALLRDPRRKSRVLSGRRLKRKK